MSIQQVNLYTEAFRPQKIVLPLSQIVLIAALLIAVLVGLSFWLSARADYLAMQADEKVAKAEALSATVQDLAAKVALLKQDESLVRHNEQLKAQIEAREQMLLTLGTVALRDSGGFSPYLIGLARQKHENLWLSRIHISSSGNSLHLEGEASRADAIPAYLQKLNAEDVFEGHAFSVFELNADEEQSRILHFTLQSSNAPESYLLAEATDAGATEEEE